jgi:polyisoprenoid-binding protein YceI
MLARTRTAWCLVLTACGILVSARAVAAGARRYTLDPAASRIVIHVGKAGVFGFAGHEHEVVAGLSRGIATVDLDRVDLSTVEVTFDAAALRVTGKGEPPEDVPKVQQTMLGPECLDVARFPTIRFVSTGVTAEGRAWSTHELKIRGKLTLHGVSREIAIPVHVEMTGDGFTATGSAELRQTDFGITPISKAGVVKVKNELRLEWRLVGRAER